MNDRMLQFFAYEHLPPHLSEVSRRVVGLGHWIGAALRSSPQRTVGLRKVREAKDCAVRAKLYKEA